MIEIAFLMDYPESISTLAQWFRDQWPAYYAGRTLTEITQDFYLEGNRHLLPIRLVAFAEGELVGTITLRERALRAFPEYYPGLGGLFVVENQRGRKIGTKLVKAGMDLAQERGYERVYAATVTASGILNRLGWQLVQKVLLSNEQTVLYRCELKKYLPTPDEP